jgi:putative DNA primase/helicase
MSGNVHPLRSMADVKAEVEANPKMPASECARLLASMEPYAAGGERLYVYHDGRYVPGKRHADQRIAELLGTDWTSRRSGEVTTYLTITSPELWESPPAGVVNLTNGLLDVRTRKLRPHTPEHLSPVQIAAAYDPAAKCPAIAAFIDSTIPDLGPVFDEVTGYLATADNRYQKAIMLTGQGGTGKSTATKVWRAMLGRENVSTVSLHQLDEDRFAAADLYGKLANIFADLPAHALTSSSIFKSVTGGDAIRGERKHAQPFSWAPFVRLVYSANEAPPTADNSDAFFERWLILPFTQKFRDTADEDHNLVEKLTTPGELSGLLNRALDGLDRLHGQRGFSHVAASDEAHERFRIDSDSAAGFIDERCTIDEGGKVKQSALFAAYKAWCEVNNRRPLAATRFNRRLMELHSPDSIKVKGYSWWLGINLTDPEEYGL